MAVIGRGAFGGQIASRLIKLRTQHVVAAQKEPPRSNLTLVARAQCNVSSSYASMNFYRDFDHD
jgi:hypothetical protein